MTILRIVPSSGEFPRLRPHALPDNAAQFSKDCDFLHGTLTGMKNSDPVEGISGSGIRSFFVYEGGAAAGNRFWWNRDVDAVRSPMVNDAYARFYWSDGSGFYVSRGDIGGNGEPSESNRYKVGVPKPAAALTLSGAEFRIPGVASMDFTLCDEASDGSTSNCVSINPTATVTSATSLSFDFVARAPQPVTGTATVTSAAASSVSGTWKLLDTMIVGGMTCRLYQNASNANQRAIYYDDPIGVLPTTIVASHRDDNDHWDTGWTSPWTGTYQRLGNTYWYGNTGSITPPTQTGPSNPAQTETTIGAPTSGPVLKARFVYADGVELLALLRPDGSIWPAELPGYVGTLRHNGGTSWSASISVAGNTLEHRAYTYTYVNQYGEEGAPADPAEVDCAEGAAIVLGYALPPDGFCPISKIRVYRTATGTATDFLFVGEVVVDASLKFTDLVKTESLGEPMTTVMHYPPDQALRGICVMANGIVAGFKGNEVHLMEPYLPYACNPNAIKPFPHRVVGICPFEGGLYVTTTAQPYILMGAEPMSMTDAKIPAIQAGVSKGSIIDMGGQVAYASHDGIVLAQGMAASLDLSFKFFTRNEWRDRYGAKLSNMRLSAHDGSLLVWFDDGSPGFMLRFEEEALSMTRLTEGFRAAFVNPVDDSLYVSDGSTVEVFRAGVGRKPFVWHSKDFTVARPENFGVLQLIGVGTVDVDIYADGTLRHTQAGVALPEAGDALLRLPSGFLARRWSVRLAGSAEVMEANLASTVAELRSV